MLDLVIRGGTIVDGSGGEARTGDIGISDGVIREIGQIGSRGHREIDADGLLVTPGWIDIHTHYDGQASWDTQIAPSFWHGVTTTVMGNCGVGFAPCRTEDHDRLISLMEGVEDIPGSALSVGISWGWESFADYLDVLSGNHYTMDIGAFLPHGPLRVYVMGERGAANEVATEDDIRAMRDIVRRAMQAGAFGVSTSRTLGHRATDGREVPGTFADHPELFAIASAIGEAGRGEMQWAAAGLTESDWKSSMGEIELMIELSRKTGCRMSYLMAQEMDNPGNWRPRLDRALAANDEGARVTPQVYAHGTGLLTGLTGWFHPFMDAPSWHALADLPLPERVARIRSTPSLREKLAQEARASADVPQKAPGLSPHWFLKWDRVYLFGVNGNFEPGPEESIGHIAKATGRDPWAIALDALTEEADGQCFLWLPVLGYATGDLSPNREMILRDRTLVGGGDGGAHCSYICDSSGPTYMLTHWARDRRRGPRLPLEFLVRKQTFEAARTLGFRDRGLLAPGMRADINIIDFDALSCGPVRMVQDLPAGASRLIQRSEGYIATMVAGAITREGQQDTGARPGRILRSGAVLH